ncbi:hypothetical protein HH214_04015 [Mucilaginibacter robiniae]|uniref:DUF4175 domain-containing protein n=1 Tax=Mucilaginibacter robiniae TaxID=2728022 RepID=A0A7L5DWH3_9SPHI|nr:hypothetical protein [Mucilaginibacter robiniae]QJD95101.1 hypothetical protein HH214_04015 [Mucilaginibacter robiniae]
MTEHNGLYKVKTLQQRWIAYQILADALLALGCALVLGSLLHFLAGWSAWWGVLVFIIVWLGLEAYRRPWQITLQAICTFLNGSYPELEESTDLVLKPADSLNLLERLQCSKVENALQHVPTQPEQFTKRLKTAGLLLVLALAISFACSKIHVRTHAGSYGLGTDQTSTGTSLPPEKVLPQIDEVNIKITPPAYTGKPSHEQDKFTLQAEEGATINWQINTNITVKKVWLLFNEHEKLLLSSTNSEHTQWKAQRAIIQPGFYQVSIDGKLSDLYQIQVIKDGVPVIHIKMPKQYTHIDAGEAPRVTLNAAVNDDYGVSDARIFATVAKGSGEAVKFKQYQFSFSTSFQQHSRQYNLQKVLDLPALNMEPGDELYFYIQARDTHQQLSRTDVLIVSIQDTAALLSMDGLVTAANIKPEYFRSERQIILDTEKLLKERDSISQDAFKTRCNDMGMDQKLLRLRYGKFLGEEDESGNEGEDHKELSKAENFGNTNMIMDAYTDKHDNAEDATFLEPAVKAQLKATLSEMWKAELHLRLYKPQEALPFEYKALRLLKDLQEKSRSYVAKTAYNPPPLKPEKRLSGDLSKIGQPVNQQEIKPAADRFITLKQAVTVLEQLKQNPALTTTSLRTLQLAGQQLSSRASAEPGIYLRAVSAMQRMLSAGKKINPADIAIVEKAIQKSLPAVKTMPDATATTADLGLAKGYYNNLNHLNR